MSEASNSAATARNMLSRALSHLQGDGVPDELLISAEPIAEAMSLLFDVEMASSRAAELAPAALRHLQHALALLQETNVATDAIDDALENVAQALSQVHKLTRLHADDPPLESAAPATPLQATDIPGTKPRADKTMAAAAQALAPAASLAAPRVPAFDGSRTALIESNKARRLVQATTPEVPLADPDATLADPDATVAKPAAQVVAPGPSLEGPPLSVDTSLGAHSSNNFYRGLSGNDVLQDGGLFVATYSPPPIGQNLILRVLMPGGYEFRARGVVRWCRDAPKTASTAPYAPPGYGAQLLDVPPEGQQLIERYVRNRVPLLHDDL